MSVLDVRNLTMRFGGITAVSDLSFSVEPGQIYSVIGPNGAGKTTVFNAITGIYTPTSGRVTFEGRTVIKQLRPMTIVTWVISGLLVSFIAYLAAAGIQQMWVAAVNKQFLSETDRFDAGKLFGAASDYISGYPTVFRNPITEKWELVDHDNIKVSYGVFDSRETALAERNRLLTESSGDTKVLSVQQTKSKHVRNTMIALVAGLPLGFLAAAMIWFRSRRTPDVISQGGVARTFQNIRLFPAMTVVENVLVGMDRRLTAHPLLMAFGLPKYRKQETAAFHDAVELLDFVGLTSQRKELARNLPYGDQRRLEIARALATEPKLLLLDEPAAGMNPSETTQLMDLIRKIRDRGITVLLIEHHMNLVMGISDRVAVLDYGVKIAEGSPQEVSRDPKVIEAYLGKEEVS